jgi:hypothetical protein
VPGYGRSTTGDNNYNWRAYYRWRPALVGFFDAPSPRGHYVGWYPLAPGQHWRRPDGRSAGDHSHLQYPTTRDGWRRPGQSTFILPPHNGRGVTLLPVGGFNRSDRSQTRPVAPDADMSNWIKRGARPGLPEIKPAPIAIAPVTRDGQRNHVAIPSNEIIHRPVVTRNRPSDSQVTANPPRERRLITPRTPVMSNDEPARREKKARTDEERMRPPAVVRPAEGQSSNPTHEKPNRQGGDGAKPRVMPAERVDGDNQQTGHRPERGNDSTNDKHRRPVYTPDTPVNSDGSGARERKQRDEEQIRQRQEERERQRNEEQNRLRNEEQNRQRQEERARQRDEERARQRDEERQKQQNEEQNRQRQRDEEQNRQRQRDEERTRQRTEEENRHRQKPPESGSISQRSEPSDAGRSQQKVERRAEQPQRKKS